MQYFFFINNNLLNIPISKTIFPHLKLLQLAKSEILTFSSKNLYTGCALHDSQTDLTLKQLTSVMLQ